MHREAHREPTFAEETRLLFLWTRVVKGRRILIAESMKN